MEFVGRNGKNRWKSGTKCNRNAKEQSGDLKEFSDVIQIYAFTSERTNFRYYNYILMVEDEFVPKISNESVTDYIWGDDGELPEPINPMVKELFVEGGNGTK